MTSLVPPPALGPAVTSGLNAANPAPILPLGSPTLSVSTIPPNGDVNPYGVAFVPGSVPTGGKLHPGDILVSNFNNSANLQGTGTTIVEVDPTGHTAPTVFFQGHAGLGLTTALGVLKDGFVLVGNVPTSDGTSATIKPGSLLVLDRNGNTVANLHSTALLDGPWDLTVHDEGNFAQVFVANVLSGTVTRLDLAVSPTSDRVFVLDAVQIGSGYRHRADPAALVVGPTGLAYDAHHDILYVASTADNAVFAIDDAGTTFEDEGKGTLVYRDKTHLHGPLALVLAPNGDLITANGDAVNPDPNQPSEIVEFTTTGKFVAEFSVTNNSADANAQGGAFGIALSSVNGHVTFAAVDDIANALDIWNIS